MSVDSANEVPVINSSSSVSSRSYFQLPDEVPVTPSSPNHELWWSFPVSTRNLNHLFQFQSGVSVTTFSPNKKFQQSLPVPLKVSVPTSSLIKKFQPSLPVPTRSFSKHFQSLHEVPVIPSSFNQHFQRSFPETISSRR